MVRAKVLPTARFNIYFSLPLTALTQLTGLGWAGLGWAVARWKLWHGLKSVSAPGGAVWRVEFCNFDVDVHVRTTCLLVERAR